MEQIYYRFDFTRAQLDLITEGLLELQGKRVLHFVSGLHQACAAQDKARDAAATADRPPIPQPAPERGKKPR